MLRVNNHDMTSELILRLEFVIQLPNTTTPQRCVVNVALDSSLPVMPAVHKDDIDRDPMSFFMLFGDDWRTVIVSIDLVDFLVAKTFQTTVEEWFNSLNKTPRHKFSILLLKNYAALRTASFQFGRIGMAIFLVVYIFANNKHSISLAGLTIACAIAMLLWSAFLLIEAPSMRNVNRNLSKNIIPSVILLNDKDQQIYEDVLTSSNSGVGTILGIITMIASSVALNVLASYLYSWMSGK